MKLKNKLILLLLIFITLFSLVSNVFGASMADNCNEMLADARARASGWYRQNNDVAVVFRSKGTVTGGDYSYITVLFLPSAVDLTYSSETGRFYLTWKNSSSVLDIDYYDSAFKWVERKTFAQNAGTSYPFEVNYLNFIYQVNGGNVSNYEVKEIASSTVVTPSEPPGRGTLGDNPGDGSGGNTGNGDDGNWFSDIIGGIGDFFTQGVQAIGGFFTWLLDRNRRLF